MEQEQEVQTGWDVAKIGRHVLAAVFIVTALVGASLAGLETYRFFTQEEGVRLSNYPSNVCGNFANPNAIAGTPIQINEGQNGAFIIFNDDYALRVKETPSMYLGRRAVFGLDNGRITQYALITDPSYHPCPELAP